MTKSELEIYVNELETVLEDVRNALDTNHADGARLILDEWFEDEEDEPE